MSRNRSPEEGEIFELGSVLEQEFEEKFKHEVENAVEDAEREILTRVPEKVSPVEASRKSPMKTLTRVFREQPVPPAKPVLEQFLHEVTSKHRKAMTEYKLLFTRWKRQSLAEVDEYNIPDWKIEDEKNILRWEFNSSTVENTIWLPLFSIMETELQAARREIETSKFAFANITLGTVDGLLDVSLAHNKQLRGALVNVEHRPPTPPLKNFVPAEVDLSEFDQVNVRSGGGWGGRQGRKGRGQVGRAPSREVDDARRSRDDSRRPDLRRRRSGERWYLGIGREFDGT